MAKARSKLAHGLAPMQGRDPHEKGRTGSALELIFDLVAVVAISIASSQLAHLFEAGHWVAGTGAFLFAVFAITWAWSSYSQLLSAFDTDDIGVRLVTLLQMGGVLLLAMGVAPLADGFDHGRLDNQVIVVGYVVMRLGAIIIWARVAHDSAELAPMARRQIVTLLISQVCWCLVAFLPLPPAIGLGLMGLCLAGEIASPIFAERSGRMPWHPHHMGERFGAFVVISLGEVVLGTLTAVQADVAEHGWSWGAVTLGAAGLGMAFGLWWVYFALPAGELLAQAPGRFHLANLVHILLYASIAAVGAGLHVASFSLRGEAESPLEAVAATVAVPAGLSIALIFVLFQVLLPRATKTRHIDPFHVALLIASLAVGCIGVAAAARGAELTIVLAVSTLMPWVAVVGFEAHGHKEIAQRIDARQP